MTAKTSLVQAAAAAILRRHQATVDDIKHLFPNHSREQVAVALSNAQQLNLLKSVSRGKRGAGSSRYGVGIPPTYGAPEPRVERRPMPRVSSIFALAQGDVIPEDWPPAFPGARVFALLTDEEEEVA